MLVDASFSDSAAEERDTDSAPLSVSGSPAKKSNLPIATADCEHGFSAMNHIKTFSLKSSYSSIFQLKAVQPRQI